MQTPPKNRDKGFIYPYEMLDKALKVACEIETGLFKKYRQEQERQEVYKSLAYQLNFKNTSMKVPLILGEISSEQLLEMKPEDFLSQEEREKWKQAEDDLIASKRSDWHKEQKLKGPRTEGFFKCKKCGSKYTSFYQ